MTNCVLLLIALLFILFLTGIGLLTFHGKLNIFNLQPGDFLAVWTLQVTFSTILLAVGGFLINFFNERILGIPLSEITRKKGIWNTFIAVIISIITPIVLYICFELTVSESKAFKIFLFILLLTSLVISLGLSYIFVCQVLNLLLKKKELETEIKQAIEDFIDKEIEKESRNATNS